jgi:hypothetical protein
MTGSGKKCEQRQQSAIFEFIVGALLLCVATFVLSFVGLFTHSVVLFVALAVVCFSPFVYFLTKDRSCVFRWMFGTLASLGILAILAELTGGLVAQRGRLSHVLFVVSVISGAIIAQLVFSRRRYKKADTPVGELEAVDGEKK